MAAVVSWRWTSAALTPVSMVCVWTAICPTAVCVTMDMKDPGQYTRWGLPVYCVCVFVVSQICAAGKSFRKMR